MTETTIETEQLPWVVFEVGENRYAVNSQHVFTIMILPEAVNHTPAEPASTRGFITLRGSVIPLLDMRGIFGILHRSEEQQALLEMLTHRKQDHLNWVEELEHSVAEDRKFPLATDPHKCKFGQWYDHYKTKNLMVSMSLRKIDEPHKRLHAAADLIEQAKSIQDAAERRARTQHILTEVRDVLCPDVVRLLDSAMEMLHDSQREMVVVLEGEQQFGLVVDDVLSVKELSAICDREEMDRFRSVRALQGVSKDQDGLILMLDRDALAQELYIA